MTAIKIPEPTLTEAHRSTSVRLSGSGDVERIKTLPRFATEWRGVSVVVEMSCDRYLAGMDRNNLRLTDWRVYASEAREKTDAEYGYGAHVSDTARSRLSAACQPVALAWLESDGFAAEYRAALVTQIMRELTENSRYRDDTGTVRRLIGRYANEIDPSGRGETVGRMFAACDAFDAYQTSLKVVAR